MKESYYTSTTLIILGMILVILGFYNMTENANSVAVGVFYIIGCIMMLLGVWYIPTDKYRCLICKKPVDNIKVDYCTSCGNLLQLEKIK